MTLKEFQAFMPKHCGLVKRKNPSRCFKKSKAMYTGKIEYIRDDPQLKIESAKAKKLTQKFNSMDFENVSGRTEILMELFGSAGTGISIEHNFNCDLGYNIHVGNNFYAGFNCTILDMAAVRIGDNCLIAPNVGIYTSGHSIHPVERYKTGYARPIIIGNNVWIGGHSVILGGIEIGDNSVVAAGSVVTKDIPANAVYAGNPAEKIKDIDKSSI